MDRVLDQLGYHPLLAAVAVAIFLAGLVLAALRRSEGVALLPKMAALALLAGSIGIASSVQVLVNVFHGMALTGSGGYGSMAAGLSEVDWVFLLGLSSAFLTLAAGLAFTRGGTAGSLAAGMGTALKPMPAWLLGLLGVLATAVVALALHRFWLLGLATDVALVPKGASSPVSGSVSEVSQRIANHLIFLALAAQGMILGGAALLIGLFAGGRRSLSSRQALWARSLAALLLVLALAGTVVLWRQFHHFVEIAILGRPF
jgi:hypothetical protein